MLDKIVSITSISAAIIAVITFVLSVNSDMSRHKKEEIELWKNVVVYDIISKAGEKGISFDTIKEKYSIESVSYKKEIPKADLQPNELKRIILKLIAGGAIENINGTTYRFNTDTGQPIGTIDQGNIAVKVMDEIQKVLFTEPGRYTIESLSKKISVSIPEAHMYLIRSIVGDGVRQKAIKVDEEGNLSLH
jgi:hypothetical protein